MFWVPQSGRLGMGVSIFSYNDKVWLGLVTDVSLVPDPDAIIQFFHDELAELHAMTQQLAEEQPTHPEPVAAVASDFENDLEIGSIFEPASTLTSEAAPAKSPGDDDLTQLKGIGPAYAARLRAGGIDTRATLAMCTPEQLAEIVQAPEWRRPDYQSWIDQAKA